MRHRHVLNCHSAMLCALVTLFAILCPIRADVPGPVHSMAYATVDEKTLYIQGGNPGQGAPLSNQFYSLDLTQSNWNAANPPWKVLSPGGASLGAPAAANHFMTVVDSGRSLMIWDRLGSGDNNTSLSGIVRYNISTSTWLMRFSSRLGSNYSLYPDFTKSGATDPATNLVYIPAVFQVDSGMAVYNPTNVTEATVDKYDSSATLAPMPPPLVIGGVLTGHSTVWSEYRSSMLVYGGRYEVPGSSPTTSSLQTPVFSDQFLEYNPTQKNWAGVATEGKSPGNRTRHCMVPAYGGRKMVVFGGSTGPGAALVPQGDIYVLDLASMTWSQGDSVSSSEFRAGMACSGVENNFIAWGGTNGESTLKSTIIYDLHTNQWTDRFSLDASTSGASNMGGIIGGSVAAVVIIGVLIGYVVYRRRKQCSLQDQVTRQDYEPHGQEYSKHSHDLETTKRDPHETVDQLALTGFPRNPAVIPLTSEIAPSNHQVRNPEHVPIVHFQGFTRTDPQYSDTPMQEPWRNPHGMAIPEYVLEDETLRRQWIAQQRQQEQQVAILQQQQQLYLDELERLRLEYERLQTSTPSTPITNRGYSQY